MDEIIKIRPFNSQANHSVIEKIRLEVVCKKVVK